MNQYSHNMASSGKRLLAAVYDSLLILAVLFIATAIALPFTGGAATSTDNLILKFYLLIVIFIFYGWFWTHGGQTLGMRAWKLQLVQFDGSSVTWKHAFIRFITALPAWGLFLYGLLLWIFHGKIATVIWIANIPQWLIVLTGFVWLLLDNRSHNWRDKISGSHIIVINKIKSD